VRPSRGFSAIVPLQSNHLVFRIVCCERNGAPSDSSMPNKFGFNLISPSPGEKSWKLSEIDTNAMQESMNQLLSRTQSFLNNMIVKSVNDRRPNLLVENDDMEDILITEQTIDSRTQGGHLSGPAVFSIEQFSRMNGLTGKKMQNIFKALVPESVSNNPRNLIEYCCFRYLSRNIAEVHPGLKDVAFQRLVFISMIAWENPYGEGGGRQTGLLEKSIFQRKLVGEDAFSRIAPTVSGVADFPTSHNLFKALSGDSDGVSYSSWSAYLSELLKVHDSRMSDQFQEFSRRFKEKILCLGSSRKQPVIRWEKNMAWPGKLTLTDKALYFEAFGLVGKETVVRLDLSHEGSRVEKTRVGPLGSNLFDSAVSITTDPKSEPLVLEFIDLRGEMRRDIWFAFINEVIAFHKFVGEYGPKDGDKSVSEVYGAERGKERAKSYAANGIARLQALQFIRRTLDDPAKLLPFSYLENAPYGDVVLQTLAVNFWGGPVLKRPSSTDYDDESSRDAYDVDGSVFLRRWKRSPSWSKNASLGFWKNATRKGGGGGGGGGVVLGKNLVIADESLVERASRTCKEKYVVVERTQATIDAATTDGIPNNIDLFKELVLPVIVAAQGLERIRRWDDPLVTASFLGVVYTILFRDLVGYVVPAGLVVLSCAMLVLKGLREQGRLGRHFGRITIFDQAPSNTLQKIIALKEAMRELEKHLQGVNVVLLKVRSVVLAGHPQVTAEVAVAMMAGSVVLLLVPFKFVAGAVILDLFTRELEFRRKMVAAFVAVVKERWDMVPAAPVVVLPFED
ncbi:hypothetical protein M569_03034, partial [Genlisea aurea]